MRKLGEAGVEGALVGCHEHGDELLLLRCHLHCHLRCHLRCHLPRLLSPPLAPQRPPQPQSLLGHDHCHPPPPSPRDESQPRAARSHRCPAVPSPPCPLLSLLRPCPLLSPCPRAAPSPPRPPHPPVPPHPRWSSLSHVPPDCHLRVSIIPFPTCPPTQVPSAPCPLLPLRSPLCRPVPCPPISLPLSPCHRTHCPSACPRPGTSGGDRPGTAAAWPW